MKNGDPRPEKVSQVEEIEGKLSSSSGVLFTEYRGLTVSEMATLRQNLAEAGGHYKVFKNTLVKRAADNRGIQGLESILTGPTAIAFVEGDIVAVAKALKEFSRQNSALVVKGALLDQSLLTQAETSQLADVAPREELLARLAGGFQAPAAKLAGLLQALPRDLAYGFSALIEKKSKEAA